MTVELVSSPSTNSASMRIARLPERYNISFPELFGRFSQLEIWPKEIDGTLCIDDLQLQALDTLHMNLQTPLEEMFLYRTDAGALKLSETPLHINRKWSLCDTTVQAISHDDGLEFIASGPSEEIMGLAHSLMLGLGDDMKGI